MAICGYVAFGPSRADNDQEDPASREIAAVIDSVRRSSFPQLKDAAITLREMRSDYIYFETRFTVSSFFLDRRLRYVIWFNREALIRQAPADGLRAIVAHELAHIDYFNRDSRMGLLALAQLLWASYNARFERSADIEAIALGYGPGLESYRRWLYRNVPPDRMEEKKRDYFSPEEIEAILQSVRQKPQIMETLSRCVPRDLVQIQWRIENPGARCSN